MHSLICRVDVPVVRVREGGLCTHVKAHPIDTSKQGEMNKGGMSDVKRDEQSRLCAPIVKTLGYPAFRHEALEDW